jgi:hypothetical protein
MHDKKPRPVGRPKFARGKAMSVLVQSRVRPQEKAAYEKAMRESGKPDLSTWIRETLNRSVQEPKE